MNDQELASRARETARRLFATRVGDLDLLRLAAGLLKEQADRAERLNGDLDAIRGILAGFDWEHDDHQYALEQIEMIADKGQQ